jgi:hypothetical protein
MVGCARNVPGETPSSTVTSRPDIEPAATGEGIAPLPDSIQELRAKRDPEFVAWADGLRGLYQTLPDEARQNMLATGACTFRLSDLPESEAKVVRDFVDQHSGAREWATLNANIGTPPDLSKLTFGFARIPPDDKYVRFVMRAPNGRTMQPEIGVWPNGEHAD